MSKITAIAVVQDGRQFRLYDDADHLGDPNHLIDSITAPVRCKTAQEMRDWFRQTLLARAIGEYQMIGDD